jgi:hypothetical protein
MLFVGLFILRGTYAIAGVPQIDQSVIITCSNSQGTGFFISKTLIATAKHVVSHCTDVNLKNNKGTFGTGRVVFVSKSDDIAILSTNNLGAPAAITPLEVNQVLPKQSVIVVGTPIDGLVMSEGTVISNSQSLTPHSILLDVPADHGSSGGPVFSGKGIIGMMIQKTENGKIVALEAQVVKVALSTYQRSHSSTASDSGDVKPKQIIITQTSTGPRLQLSIILNIIFLGIIITLFLLRKKRFSRKRIVINLESKSSEVISQEMENK